MQTNDLMEEDQRVPEMLELYIVKDMTLQEVGKHFNLSRERVRQLIPDAPKLKREYKSKLNSKKEDIKNSLYTISGVDFCFKMNFVNKRKILLTFSPVFELHSINPSAPLEFAIFIAFLVETSLR